MLESGILLQNRYEIIQPIGKGGMGAVYLARDQRLGNTIALKETFFNDAMMVIAFEREARLLAGLRHAALPKVMDHFADDNGQFLVMEFIPGEDLEDLLQNSSQAFQMEEVLQWADQLLDALDYLHSQDPPVIHRDIKPQNLKLSSRNQVVLLDFGLAKNTAANTTTTTSGKSLFAYTPIYAPLEQIQGAGTDARSDIYSLGATLYHLLTGDKPVDALTRAGDFLNGKPDPLVFAHEKNARVSPAVSEVIEQAMALNRDLRPASAIVMRKLIRDAVQLPTDNPGNQGKTIMSQTRAFHANTNKAFSVDSTRISASQPLPYGQATPKTNANAARQLATHQRPATPKYAGSNSTDKSPWVTTPAWSHSQTQLQTSESSGKGKWMAAAVVFVILSVILVLRFNGNSNAESEIKPTNPALVEQPNVNNQGEVGTKGTTTPSQPQYQPSSSSTMPEPVSTQQQAPQQTAEEKPAISEPATTSTAEPVAAKQEPAKTETPQTQPQMRPGQLQPDGRPYDPMHEGDRRQPPPNMGPPPPEGYPPPPRREGPPPADRRRP